MSELKPTVPMSRALERSQDWREGVDAGCGGRATDCLDERINSMPMRTVPFYHHHGHAVMAKQEKQ